MNSKVPCGMNETKSNNTLTTNPTLDFPILAEK